MSQLRNVNRMRGSTEESTALIWQQRRPFLDVYFCASSVSGLTSKYSLGLRVGPDIEFWVNRGTDHAREPVML